MWKKVKCFQFQGLHFEWPWYVASRSVKTNQRKPMQGIVWNVAVGPPSVASSRFGFHSKLLDGSGSSLADLDLRQLLRIC